jgi:ACS family hexuronate transporter-like MFS transporter
MDEENIVAIPPASETTSATNQASPPDGIALKIGHYRWTICALLFFAMTINYLDRQVISYLKEFFCRSTELGGFGWTNKEFSYLTSFFTGVYALMSVGAGRLIDKIGTKLGLAGSLVVWSVFGILNALAGATVAAHVAIRSLFAVGEAGSFPASNRTIAEWFPKKERALAIGIFNSGTNLGAMIAALFVPWCMVFFGDQLGWRMAFVLTGVAGFVWLIFWFWLYETPKNQRRLSKAEYDYIHMDDVEAQSGDAPQGVPWARLFRYRQTWSFFVGKMLTDGIWWFYLFWLPDYLIKQFNMAPADVRWPTFIVYGISIVGSVYGGSIPMTLINRGMEVYKARMTAMILIALCPLTVLFTQYFGSTERYGTRALYFAVGIISIGAAAHQAWSANLFTTVSDMFPKKAVASITGIGTMAGGVGGVLIQLLVGSLRDRFKGAPQTAYFIMFAFCALAYVCAWAIMKALVPRYKLVTDL